MSWNTACKPLERLRAELEHFITSLGVAYFNLELLEELVPRHTTSKVAVVQNGMDPVHQDRAVRQFAKEHNIQYMASSSFGTQWHRWPNVVLTDQRLVAIATKHQCSVAQVVPAGVIPAGAVAIPRSSRVHHPRAKFGQLPPTPARRP